jgi:uncharacterized protein (TIGR02145 family)
MMKKAFTLLMFFLIAGVSAFAQVAINTDNSPPDGSAGLDVNFDNKGFLPPRMSFEQRNAILNPVEGLMVYCTNCNQDGTGNITIFQSGTWINLTGSCIPPASPPAGSHIPTMIKIVWKWNRVPIATGYKWNTTTNPSTAIDMGTDTSTTETGLSCWTTYTRYVWAYNACGNSSMRTLSQTTSQIPFSTAPTEGVHVAGPVTITWNWNPVEGATGYKWSLTNDFNTATDMANATTKFEAGLTCGTEYTRFVWAYNGCGYSTPVSLIKSTAACLICGTSVTINHVAGTVAPVTKTVTYGIVTNIPGLTYACWISRNLGAGQQATAVSDATEASAGWYWQFNRKQGYQYTTTRLPNTTWITSISETSDWIAANDPCTIELGSGWRIPTSAEWTNVNASGNWIDWNGPWNSALKMHAAGYLLGSDGSLDHRGSIGQYWSSSQNNATYCWYLGFNSAGINMTLSSRVYGYTARCIRDF